MSSIVKCNKCKRTFDLHTAGNVCPHCGQIRNTRHQKAEKIEFIDPFQNGYFKHMKGFNYLLCKRV